MFQRVTAEVSKGKLKCVNASDDDDDDDVVKGSDDVAETRMMSSRNFDAILLKSLAACVGALGIGSGKLWK